MILGSLSTAIIGKTHRVWLLFYSLACEPLTRSLILRAKIYYTYLTENNIFCATIDPYKPGGSWFPETKREKCNRKRISDVIFPEQLLLFGRTSHFSHTIIIIILLFLNGIRSSATASNTKGIFIDLSFRVCTSIL